MTRNQDSLEIANNSSETRNLFNKSRLYSLTNVIQTIRGKTTEREILQLCVAQVYEVLKCDRVVVYSLLSESQGKIIAEALTPGFSPTIDSIIKDPCFEARYVDLYQKGRVRVIDNIYEAGMSPCYVENLEKIEVKANLVVPLNYTDNSLFGLLVTHQCSAFRQWELAEVNFAIQIAGWAMEQISYLKKYARLQTQLDQTVEWQNSLQKITHDIHRVNNCDDVLQVTVDRVREILQCDRTVIYGLYDKIVGKIVAESTLPSLKPIKERIIKDPCFEYRFIDKYRQGRTRAINNIYQADLTTCYVENLEKISVKSNLVVPINWQNGELFGLLVAHECFEFRKWQDQESNWLQKVGVQTGLALSRSRLEAELSNLKSSKNSLKAAREIIKFTKIKTQKIGESLQNFNQVLSEVNNLNRILNKEVALIAQSDFKPEKKEIKVMQILAKKMTVNVVKLKKYLDLYQTHVNHMKDILDEAVIRKLSN
ncbi:GAF domain-containing protein [Pleurocapsa sp. PCC 7319]|uniref:GAF domain-containing protein n=1 Tax=Pleurocapsa sp. PCC 7319 TaxID=118161 RepID=UPI000346347B|nr:GAF domain-containing protein [Pleurocapsa sp. PCC 7319]